MRRLRWLFVSGSIFTLTFVALGQAPSPKLPCDFSGDLRRDAQGGIARYSSDEMKERATAKTDLSGFIKQLDIRTVVLANVLVGPSGQVVCAKSLTGLPMVLKPVETALQSWKFKPMTFNGRPIAYLGLMQFTLCNTSCGEEGPSMTLLK